MFSTDAGYFEHRWSQFLAVLMLLCIMIQALPSLAAPQKTVVPQLSITSLQPVKVVYAPADDTLLMVVNADGRIDLLDISNPAAPVKISEIFAGATDAAFKPGKSSRADMRIVSGGQDGTLRLWSLDGKPAAEPFKGHEGRVTSVAFSPDGTRIVSGARDGNVRLWTRDGKSTAEPIKGHFGLVSSIGFSPDGTRIAFGDENGTLRLWTLDGTPVGEPFNGHSGPVYSVTFSPDGTRLVSGGRDGTVRLWTLDGKPAAEPFKGHYGGARSVTFSSDGTRIASGGYDGTVRLWTLDGKPATEPIKGHNGVVFSVGFSPDGARLVSGGRDGTVRLWTLDGKTAEPFKGHYELVSSVAFSPDGTRIASGDEDGTLRLWSLDGTPVGEPFKGHDGWVRSVAFSPDGTRLASWGYGTVRLWTLDGKPAAEPFKDPRGAVLSVGFSPDGMRIVSGSSDGTVRLWTLDGKPAAEPFKVPRGAVFTAGFSPDGTRFVSGGLDGTVRLWTLDGKPVGEPFKGHDGTVSYVGFSPDGTRLVSGDENGTLRLWTLDGKPVGEPLKAQRRWVTSVSFSHDGTRLVSGGEDGTVRLWTRDGKPAAEPIKVHDEHITSVSFSPDGTRLVTGGEDGTVRLWTLDGKPVAEPFKGRDGEVTSVGFSTDGTRLVSGSSDGTVRLWTLDGKPAAEPFKTHNGVVSSVGFSPDGTRIVSRGEAGTVHFWTLDGKPVAEPFKGRDGEVTSVGFSPDGTRFVSGGLDGTVRLWTLDGKPVGEPFKGHRRKVTSVSFSPDGTRLISGDDDGTVRLWALDGKPAAAPIKGHEEQVSSVGFSPDGTRIVSAGRDGTVRLWSRDGQHLKMVQYANVGFSPDGMRLVTWSQDRARRLMAREGLSWEFPQHGGGCNSLKIIKGQFIAAYCSDRIVILDENLQALGQLFLLDDGIAASLSGNEGVYIPSARSATAFRLITASLDVDWSRDALADASVSLTRVHQVLFDEWTWRDWLLAQADAAGRFISETYTALGWWRAPFWPALLMVVTWLAAIALWVFAPARLAAWGMRKAGSAGPPPIAWLMTTITLFNYLGGTRRPLDAWLRRHRASLLDKTFRGRTPVVDRARYSAMTHETAIAQWVAAYSDKAPFPLWISGAGGSGKSALAFAIAGRAAERAETPLPVLIDEDWSGTILDLVATLLTCEGRSPSPARVESLCARGKIGLIFDSLSERRNADATKQIADLVGRGAARKVIITARSRPPEGQVWEKFQHHTAQPITPADVESFAAAYVPAALLAETLTRLKPFVAEQPTISPLFLRFALERAMGGDIPGQTKLDLAFDYVEALRKGPQSLSGDDFRRASAVVAVEVIRDALAPREIEPDYLRGVLGLVAGEMPFLPSTGEMAFNPAAIIEMLTKAGLLNRNAANKRLQFAYDPVAELLAAWRVHLDQKEGRLAELRRRLEADPQSPVARALAEMEPVGSG